MPSSILHRASREPRERRRDLILWLGVLAGPVVWLTMLETNYVLSYVACELRQTWFLHAATVVSLALVGVAGAASLAEAKRERGAPHALTKAHMRSDTRTIWMAWAGVAMSAWFAIVIVVTELPVMILPPCTGR